MLVDNAAANNSTETPEAHLTVTDPGDGPLRLQLTDAHGPADAAESIPRSSPPGRIVRQAARMLVAIKTP